MPQQLIRRRNDAKAVLAELNELAEAGDLEGIALVARVTGRKRPLICLQGSFRLDPDSVVAAIDSMVALVKSAPRDRTQPAPPHAGKDSTSG